MGPLRERRTVSGGASGNIVEDRRTRRRVVLQQSQKLDLKPGDRDFVVDVIGGELLLDDDLRDDEESGDRPDREGVGANLAEPIDRLLVAHGKCLEVVLGERHDETGHGERDPPAKVRV